MCIQFVRKFSNVKFGYSRTIINSFCKMNKRLEYENKRRGNENVYFRKDYLYASSPSHNCRSFLNELNVNFQVRVFT